MQSYRAECTLPGTPQTTPVNTTVSVLSRLGDQACDTNRHQNCPPPKPSSARASKPGHQTGRTRSPFPTGERSHSTTLCQGRPKHDATPWPLEVGRHDSIPPYFGKPACTTIRKTNVLQRALVFQSGHQHSINQPQLSIFLLQGRVFIALQPNNYQTFAKLKISIPSHLFGTSFSFHGPLGDAGGKPETHSMNRGWAANFLAESPMFLLQYPSFHQRIANRKGGGHVDGKFTSRWSDGRMKGG
jgi:hypothetical protein